MKASKVVVVAVALLVAAGIVWYWRSSGARDQPQAAEKALPTAATASNAGDRRAGAPKVRKLASREIRERLLQAIRSAHQRRNTAAPTEPPKSNSQVPRVPSPGTGDDGNSSDSDKDYIQDSMSGLLPMIVDCYKQARETQPALAGTLVVNFTIEGEPGIGGLVTESTIDPEQSEIKDPGLGECVQETMFALEIDPPTNGGTVKVTYPFTFRPKN